MLVVRTHRRHRGFFITYRGDSRCVVLQSAATHLSLMLRAFFLAFEHQKSGWCGFIFQFQIPLHLSYTPDEHIKDVYNSLAAKSQDVKWKHLGVALLGGI